jgi:hypothetical protein
MGKIRFGAEDSDRQTSRRHLWICRHFPPLGSRGSLQAAYDLGRAAAQNLSAYAYEKPARLVTVTVLAKMIKDLSMADAPPDLLGIFSTALLPAILEAENDDRHERADCRAVGVDVAELVVNRHSLLLKCGKPCAAMV